MFKRALTASLAIALAGCVGTTTESSSSKAASSAVAVSSVPIISSSIPSSSSVRSSAVASSSSVAPVVSSAKSSSSSVVRSSSSAVQSSSSVAPQPAGCAPLVQSGQQQYANKCVNCHGAVGAGGVTAGAGNYPPIHPTDTTWGSGNLNVSMAVYIAEQMKNFTAAAGGCDLACGEAIQAFLASKTNKPWCPVVVASSVPASSSSAPVTGSSVRSSSSAAVVSSSSVVASSSAPALALPVMPGRIESERYSAFYDTTPENKGSCGNANQAVDLQPKATGGGTCDVNWTDPSEWLEYRFKVASAGSYDFYVSLASANTAKTVTVALNGQNVGNATAPAKGWTTFELVKAGSRQVAVGEHTVRITVNTGGLNIDALEIRAVAASSSSAASSAPSQAALDAGRREWTTTCDTCHGDQGQGGSAFPFPISDFYLNNRTELVNKIYNTMPPANPKVNCDQTCSSNVADFMIAGYPGTEVTPPPPVSCTAAEVNAHDNTPIRLLNTDEFTKFAQTVFASMNLKVAALIEDKTFFDDKNANGFASNTGITVDKNNIDKLIILAEAIGKQAGTDFAKLMTCGVNANCVNMYVRQYGGLLYRQPLTDVQVNELMAVFNKTPNATGIGHVTAAMLLAGSALYAYETKATARRLLTGREIADRLSLLIWGMPAADKTLLDKANAGTLNTLAGLREEALRMLADAKAQGGLRSFYDGYLGIEKDFLVVGKDTNANAPSGADFTVNYGNVSTDIMRFASHLTIRTEGTFADLLLSNIAFVDAKMAKVYGVPNSALTNAPKYLNGSEVTLNTQQRAGLLTRAGFVIYGGGDKVGLTSPTQRGEHMRKQVLCQLPPKAPGDVAFPELPDPSEKSWVQTLKEIHLVDNDNNPNTPNPCVTCHKAMDPVGFAFENYALNGQYIDRYPNGTAIDSSGWLEALVPTKDYDDRTFNDALEFSKVIAQSDDAAACFAHTWMGYALERGVVRNTKDACAAQVLADTFKDKQYSLRELILALVANPSFRFRNPD